MNKTILMGRLTRDPEIRYTQGDNSMCIARYTLAVDRRFAQRDESGNTPADFIPCVAFGKSGEFVEKYLKKGMKIAVTGRIQTGSYTNKEGVKVYTTEVVVEDQEFAESKKDGNTQQYGGQYGGQPNGQYGGQPNGQYGGQPNGQYGGQPNGQYGGQPNGQYGGQPNGQYGGQPNGQYGGQPNGQYGGQPNQPNGQYGGQPNGQYGGQPNGQYGGQPNRQYGGQPNGQYGGQYGGQQQANPQGGAPAQGNDSLDGFMNIPDGIDEELPFA